MSHDTEQIMDAKDCFEQFAIMVFVSLALVLIWTSWFYERAYETVLRSTPTIKSAIERWTRAGERKVGVRPAQAESTYG